MIQQDDEPRIGVDIALEIHTNRGPRLIVHRPFDPVAVARLVLALEAGAC